MNLKLNYNNLWILADYAKESYAKAEPFPHIVLNDFIPAEVCKDLLSEFPGPDELSFWKEPTNQHTVGKQVSKIKFKDMAFGQQTRQWLYELNSGPFLEFLSKLSGIEGLIGDPFLAEGGFHNIKPGGFLDIHADFSRHDRLGLERRLNLLCYLNVDWKEVYGGHICLYDKELKPIQKVLPVARRCVIFTTNETSFHGHPNPLTCPPDRTRKSFALYYYSATRPAGYEAHRIKFPTDPNFKP